MRGIGTEAFSAVFQRAGIHQQRVRREVAEQRRQRLVEEQRLPVFDPGRQRAFTDLLVNMLGVAFNFKCVTPLAAEQLDGRFIGRKFMRGQQIDGVDFFQRTLGIGIKQAQAVDFIIKKSRR